jgi:hypothetical protein
MQRFQPTLKVLLAAFVAPGPGMDHDTAGESLPRRLVPDDEMIVAQGQQGLGHRDLAVARLFRIDFLFVAKKNNLAKAFGRA